MKLSQNQEHAIENETPEFKERVRELASRVPPYATFALGDVLAHARREVTDKAAQAAKSSGA